MESSHARASQLRALSESSIELTARFAFLYVAIVRAPAFAGPGGSGAAPGEPALGAAALPGFGRYTAPALAPPEPPPAQWQKDAGDYRFRFGASWRVFMRSTLFSRSDLGLIVLAVLPD